MQPCCQRVTTKPGFRLKDKAVKGWLAANPLLTSYNKVLPYWGSRTKYGTFVCKIRHLFLVGFTLNESASIAIPNRWY